MLNGRFLCAHLDEVMKIALPVLNGVRADGFQLAFQAAINGKVIGRDFDHHILPGPQKGHILGLNPGLHQKSVVQGDKLHDRLARLDHPTHGIDMDLLDRAAHGGAQLGARHPVAAGGNGFAQAGEFQAAFGDLLRYIGLLLGLPRGNALA